jgi:NAD(P)-dependent dehydrogenase (short-subunit alcohol dehydrogenase family)
MQQVFITGASSDIGIATCKKYITEGFRVVGHFNNGQKSFFDLVDTSPNMQSLQIDLSNSNAVEKAFAENKDLLQQTDVLINMAATFQAKPFPEIVATDIVEAMNVNLIPALLFMRSITPKMVKRKWGRIVNISSIGVKFGGGSNSFCYALSKHALEFLPSDHKIWAASNVLVNTLRVGVTDTKFHENNPTKNMASRVGMIPVQRMARSDEIANAIYLYGSDQNTYTTGQVISVSGGE